MEKLNIPEYNQSILEQITKEKQLGKKIVFTNGVFDIIHPGHVDILQKAKQLGDILVVALNSDASVKRIKGENRPINELEARIYVLSAVKPVDYVVAFEENTPETIISIIQPHIHVKGGDYKKEDMPETKVVEHYGGEVIIIPFALQFSVSNLLKRITENDISKLKPKDSFAA